MNQKYYTGIEPTRGYYLWIKQNPPTDGENCSEYYKKYCLAGGTYSENSFTSGVISCGNWHQSKSASDGSICWRPGRIYSHPYGWTDCNAQ